MAGANFTQHTFALRGLLHTAGIRGDVQEIANQYWPPHSDYDEVRTPWLRVFTHRGVIVVGWRKRVIEIDWSDSVIERHGRDVVAQQANTHGPTLCHAYGWTEAAECLQRLWGSR